MITRTFKTFKATAKRVEWKDGNPFAITVGSATFEGSAPTKTEVRKALRAHGIEIKRGDQIDVEIISERILAITDEVFLANAFEVTREEQQD